jgi:prophage antirepressor-like protein
MQSELKLLSYRDHDLRIIMLDDEPWFVGKDITLALGFTNPNDTLRYLPDKSKRTQRLATRGGEQNMSLISESGVYRLIMRSKKDEAVEFQDWVCNDLLPTLRKSGQYKLQQEHEMVHHEAKLKLYEAQKELVKMHKYVARCNRNHIPGNSIYVLSHDAFESTLYKLGYTKSLNSRLSTYGTGVPPGHDYTVVYHRLVPDMVLVESILKRTLLKYKINRGKEWFEVPDIKIMIDEIEATCEFLQERDDLNPITRTTEVSEVPPANPPAAKRAIKNSEKLPMKPCNTCGVTKSLEDFHIAGEHVDGRENICKPCRVERQAEILVEKKKNYVEKTEKECNKCHDTLPLDDFYRDKSLVDGYMNKCKPCHNATQKKAQKTTVATEKKCTSCKNTKPIDEFYKASKSPDGHSIYCKPCMTDKDKAQANRRNERKQEKRKRMRDARQLASKVEDEKKKEQEAVEDVEQEAEEDVEQEAEEEEEQEEEEEEVTTKRCSSCALTFPHTEYYKNKSSKDGYVSSCKSCSKERQKKGPSKKIEIKEKKCSKCKETKQIKEFSVLKQRKDGHASYCKYCANTYHTTDEAKERAKENKKRLKEVKKAKEAQIQLVAEVSPNQEESSDEEFEM